MGELNILISLIAAEGSGMCSPGGARTGTCTWKRSIFQDLGNIPNSAGCFWHCFCRNTHSEHHHWRPGQLLLLLPGTHKVEKTRGRKPHWDAEISGCREITSLLLHLEVFLEYFPFFFMKCNYANEGALIIIHLQHPWRLLGARGSSPAGSSRDPLAGRAQGGTAPPGEPVLLGIWMNKNR